MIKTSKFLKGAILALVAFGFASCSSDGGSGDSESTNPNDLYNTTWLYEESTSESEECTENHYEESSDDVEDDDENNYTQEKTNSESKTDTATTTVNTYYLRTTGDGDAYFGKASFSRTTTTTYDEVTYTYTNKSTGLTYTDTENENEKTTVTDGEKTYTPLYKGSLSVDSTNATATYTFTESYSDSKWQDSSSTLSADYAEAANLYKSSTTPYPLSVNIKGSTLKLIYKTETSTCGLDLDKDGTKCTTQLKTEYYGKWTKVSYDSTMIGSDASSGSGSGSTYTMADIAGTWSGTGTVKVEGYSWPITYTVVLNADGSGYDNDPEESATPSESNPVTWTLSGNTVTIKESDGSVVTGTLTSATTMTFTAKGDDFTSSGSLTKSSDSTSSSSSSSSSGSSTTETTGTTFDYVTTDTSNPLGAALAKLSAGETLADGTYGEVTIGQYKKKYSWGTYYLGGTSACSLASDGQYLALVAGSGKASVEKGSNTYDYDGAGVLSIKVKKGASIYYTAKQSSDSYDDPMVAIFEPDDKSVDSTSRSSLYLSTEFEEREYSNGWYSSLPAGTLSLVNASSSDTIEISEIKVVYED